MNDGNSLYLDWDEVLRAPLRDYADDKYDDNLFNPVETPIQTIRLEPITESTWPGLALYKDRIITAAQNDRTFADNALYVFLTGNQYLIYNIPQKPPGVRPARSRQPVLAWPCCAADDLNSSGCP